MLKLIVGYVHLLATCLALGSVMVADLRLYRGRKYPLRQGTQSRLADTGRAVMSSLLVLWITGPLLLWITYSADPASFTMTGKLFAKITVVTVLTINGCLLHLFAFPRLRAGVALMQRPLSERCAFAALGAISCISWLFAAFLGVARTWNAAMGYQTIILLYAVLLATGVLAAMALFAWSGQERSLVSDGFGT